MRFTQVIIGASCFATLSTAVGTIRTGASLVSGVYPTSKCTRPRSVNSTASVPHSTCNGTTTRPPGPTGTGSHRTTSSRSCLVTTTLTFFTEVFSIIQPVTSTTTFLGDGPIIYGDTLTPVNGTATATISTTTTTTIPETTTETLDTVVQSTIGVPSTVTVPPPTDFLPVQSTLPNATYNYSNPCDISTSRTTNTISFEYSSASTTLSGTVILFYNEDTAYSSASFTNFSISYVTSTSIVTQYEATATSYVPVGTDTLTATTTTVYAACATDNFADSVVADHVAVPITFPDYNPDNQTSGTVPGPESPYECCNYAFAHGADTWVWVVDLGCSIVAGTDGVCTPSETSDTVEIGGQPGQAVLDLVLGNALCGRYTNAAQE